MEFHGAASGAEQASRFRDARERWGSGFIAHLFSARAEYRYDHGVASALVIGEDADFPYDVAEREYFLVADKRRVPGVAALHRVAATGRVKVQEFLEDGAPVDLKLQEFA